MVRRGSRIGTTATARRAGLPAFAGLAASLAAVATLASSGCFYLDDINQRPAIEIARITPTAIERGTTVALEAIVRDPDSSAVSLSWSAYACAATLDDCDEAPIAEGTAREFSVAVPLRTAAGRPVQHLRITLSARDDRGAAALVPQRLDLDVVNAAPQITALQTVGRGFVVGRPLELRAQRSDADDPVESVSLTWEVFPPAGSSRPARILLSASHSPISSPNICLISGEVMKSTARPSGSRDP